MSAPCHSLKLVSDALMAPSRHHWLLFRLKCPLNKPQAVTDYFVVKNSNVVIATLRNVSKREVSAFGQNLSPLSCDQKT